MNDEKRDINLWSQIKKGDVLAYHKLYDQYINVLFTFGMQYTNDDTLVQDAIHDVFVDLHRYRNNIAADVVIKSYLFKALQHDIFKKLKSQTKTVCLDILSEGTHKTDSIEDELIYNETTLHKNANLAGIQGHSFGGYETSFLITKTDLFSCAIIGSGVSNFTSNYPVMRSNGISTMFKYEVDQYRMGSSLFDNLDGYIKNSPLFSAKNVTTPALIFHNDGDSAVPYQEGQSLFFALRRLGKEAWLVNYKKESHTLDKANNRKDWTLKMQQYFDYYLKGSDRPDWM
ncbi:prolyl oligopeptidase family serine peptidase [Flavobacterium sp. W22_SRS_FK3]|uniref:prolyl oligopeptidase family serine peptidase n=1 Tax=Flavobacterium sp. W22_SRS_FK3 TaxID=3240275 RepID=UPI003F92F775